MIICKTPLRVTIAGGGTDLPNFYRDYGGFLVTTAIKQYMYICVNKSDINASIRIKYSKSEEALNLSNIKHSIARECLKDFKIFKGIEVVSISDVPAGTGLGSSSAYAVGLINCLGKLKNKQLSYKQLAEKACDIEINKLKKPIGKQDQYIAAYGGLKKLIISKSGNVTVNKIQMSKSNLKKFEDSIVMFYTGDLRNNDKILSQQKNNMKEHSNSRVTEIYKEIKEIGKLTYYELLNGNLYEVGKLFDYHWNLKKKLASGITSEHYDFLYKTAIKNGAIGGKITGAGGGGFFTFVTMKNNRTNLIDKMKRFGLKEFNFKIEQNGSNLYEVL